MSKKNNAGFTIIELLIATAVLSTILVLVTTMMINIGNLYYKGINQARIQDNVRSITEEISQQLQLNNAPPPPKTANLGGFSVQAYCIGGTRYSYVLGKQIIKNIRHVLWRDNISAGSECDPLNLNIASPSASGTELIAPNSRLLELSISPASPYTVVVREAYGDTDLLTDTTPNARCKGETGQQFCATAGLVTTVVRRL